MMTTPDQTSTSPASLPLIAFTGGGSAGHVTPNLALIDELTLDLDPDNEFLWSDAAVAKVQQQFRSLVESAGSGELSDYTLRRIGTDLEGFIRQLLQAGELSYNPDGRVQNFSMGLPRTPELL